MKNLKVWAVILPLLTIACSDDYTSETTKTEHISNSAKKLSIQPDNAANPFDMAGSVHNEIMETLEQTNFNSQSIEQIAILIDSVATICPEIISLPNDTPLSSRLSEITWIVNSNNAVDDVLAVSTLSTIAKTNLVTFVNSLLLAAPAPYEDIHSMIVSYEAAVLNNSTFSTNDKRIILITTSVARYVIYSDERKDKDWETGVSRIAATVSGAEHGIVLGLKMALTIGLCQNNNVTQ